MIHPGEETHVACTPLVVYTLASCRRREQTSCGVRTDYRGSSVPKSIFKAPPASSLSLSCRPLPLLWETRCTHEAHATRFSDRVSVRRARRRTRPAGHISRVYAFAYIQFLVVALPREIGLSRAAELPCLAYDATIGSTRSRAEKYRARANCRVRVCILSAFHDQRASVLSKLIGEKNERQRVSRADKVSDTQGARARKHVHSGEHGTEPRVWAPSSEEEGKNVDEAQTLLSHTRARIRRYTRFTAHDETGVAHTYFCWLDSPLLYK